MTTYNFEDKTKRYFFHNVYGDEQDLLDSLPENVIPIPFGWTEEVENNRKNVESELIVTAFELPCLAFWTEGYQIVREDEDWTGDPMIENINSHWHLLGIKTKVEKPWTWEKIDATISQWELNKTASINY